MDPPSLDLKGSLPEIWPFELAGDPGAMLGVQRMAQYGQNPSFSEMGANRDVSAEESTVTEQSGGSRNWRKRRDLGTPVSLSEDESSKHVSNSSGNELTDSEAKRVRASGGRDDSGDSKPEVDASLGICNKTADENAQPSEAPKQDYIHVRARRGQATDSHSLAERARREKISERMKILQDLVPGCNKVIGKALVLDEIINYIQSLQRQVEFLSMKLEAVSSRMSTSNEAFPAKGFGIQTFDTASGLGFSSPPAREYCQESSTEWLHMQVGGGFERAS